MTDLAALLLLNNAHAEETGPLDAAALSGMIAMSAFSITDDAGGLLIAFDQDAEYDSANFLWFKARYPRFIYVDRIIIGPSLRGKGMALSYYRRLFEHAKAAGHTQVTCEINIVPPNPASLAFHKSAGFHEVGTAALANGKTVSYQQKLL
jgi:predicted GNAT superfamily acetyltransferase